MMTYKFIYTSDSDAIKQLNRAGYQLIQVESNGIHVYLNNTEKQLTFATGKVSFSNILTF